MGSGNLSLGCFWFVPGLSTLSGAGISLGGRCGLEAPPSVVSGNVVGDRQGFSRGGMGCDAPVWAFFAAFLDLPSKVRCAVASDCVFSTA